MDLNKELIFITGNENKLREARSILNYDIKNHKVDLPEIQAINVIDVVKEKVKAAYEVLGVPVLVEDTGVYFNGMNKFPGALIKWVLDSVGTSGIYNMLSGFSDKSAYAETILGVYDGINFEFYSGKLEGKIVSSRGDSKFGWDNIFEVSGVGKTFGEMGPNEKNKISMRKIAFENLKNGNKIDNKNSSQ